MITLKPKYDSEYYKKALDALIDSSIGLFQKGTATTVNENISKLQIREEVIIEHLSSKTNFVEEFDQLRASYGNLKHEQSTIIRNLLADLGKSRKRNTFDNFLILLNHLVAKIKQKPLQTYILYIPLRMKLTLQPSEISELRRLCRKSVGIDLLSPPKYIYKQINSQKFISFMRNRATLKASVTARDIYFASNVVEKEVDSLLGVIAFSMNLYRTRHRWSFKEDNHAISDSIAERYAIISNAGKIIHPAAQFFRHFELSMTSQDLSIMGAPFWEIKNDSSKDYDRFLMILKLLAGQEKGVKERTKRGLRLYLEACIEKSLELSFLKFWIIIELLVKQDDPRTDDYVINIMQKIVKDKQLTPFVDSLYKKRNLLVHQFNVVPITQEDRNLAKAVAEQLLIFLIDPPVKFRTVQDLKICLQHVFSSETDLKATKRIVSQLIRKKQ